MGLFLGSQKYENVKVNVANSGGSTTQQSLPNRRLRLTKVL